MKKIVLYSFICFTLIGCGGEGSEASNNTNNSGGNTSSSGISNSGNGGEETTFLSPKDINLTKDRQNGNLTIDDTASIDDQYLSVVNYLRSLKIKCNDKMAEEGPSSPNLVWNEQLKISAQEHSNDMANSPHWGHDGSGTQYDITGQIFTPPRASSVTERIERSGYVWSKNGENIAVRFSSPNKPSMTAWIDAMENWIKSHTGHCSNIMNPNFRDFGMAEARGDEDKVFSDGVTRKALSAYWTQNFGAR